MPSLPTRGSATDDWEKSIPNGERRRAADADRNAVRKAGSGDDIWRDDVAPVKRNTW
jgi:hypothetical protein